jgi:Flp pilus assembly protein TadG
MHGLDFRRAKRWLSWRKNLVRDDSGATMLEFALIAPFFLLTVMAVIELSLIMLAQNVLESATFTASREGKTGFISNGISRQQTILNTLDQHAGSLLDINQITITELAYNSFSSVGQPEPFVDANGNGKWDPGENFTDINGNGVWDSDQGASGPGAAGQVVVYTVSYPWHIFTPVVSRLLGASNGTITLSARAVVQDEPF